MNLFLLLYDVKKQKNDLENILDRILHLFEDCYQGKEQVGKIGGQYWCSAFSLKMRVTYPS
ncbi:hypothetical protein QW180_20040 [Vibrio sinaloensis]|nr:hypothetical protein [Vibrio sinaloensis]